MPSSYRKRLQKKPATFTFDNPIFRQHLQRDIFLRVPRISALAIHCSISFSSSLQRIPLWLEAHQANDVFSNLNVGRFHSDSCYTRLVRHMIINDTIQKSSEISILPTSLYLLHDMPMTSIHDLFVGCRSPKHQHHIASQLFERRSGIGDDLISLERTEMISIIVWGWTVISIAIQ